jgi:hypothetical protein
MAAWILTTAPALIISFNCFSLAMRKESSSPCEQSFFYGITIDEMFKDFGLDFQIYNLPTNIGS